jgi:hypothetical protein
MSDLKEIKNFGPYMVKIMNLIGIHSREELMASDYKTIKEDLVKKRNSSASEYILLH